MNRITDTIMPHKTIIRLSGVARNLANGFPARLLGRLYWRVDSASERIKLGLDRARARGKRVGRPPALATDQVEQCRRMAEEGAGLRQIARVMTCSSATVKKALAGTHLET